MPMVVGVTVRRIKDKIYAYSGRFNLKLNDKIVLETEHGIETGIICEKEHSMTKVKDPLGRVLRIMNDDDKRKIVENEKKNLKVQSMIVQKFQDYELDMKLTCVQYTFDRSKLFIYYTAETRIDFRKLIKDLGSMLKTRIQMVQIGVRDEAKMVGGIGTCGQVLCCSSFLEDFNSVSIDMAKDQDLSLNVTKLSGLCGRLMCCLAYENDTYREIKKDLPEIGTVIATPEGKAKLAAIDCIRQNVVVDFGSRNFKTFSIKQIKDIKK